MVNWQPTLTWNDAVKRASIIKTIRAFFDKKSLIEVETPQLGAYSVTDAYLDSFSALYKYQTSVNSSQNLFLQTSPEYAMKRLLAAGYGSCFQISKAFRNESEGRNHNPEFTLLEWYRLGFDHFDLMDEVSELLTLILHCDTVDKISYQTLFIEHTCIDPLRTSVCELRNLLTKHKMLSEWLLKEDSIDILLQFCMSELIEPHIGLERPCFVYDFPRSQASLARISPLDNRVAERFECYYKGIELLNGFHELSESSIQRDRFCKDNARREKINKEPQQLDERFLAALSHGLPDCSGVALGIDRLVMLALGKTQINEVITFPTNLS